MPLFYIQDDDRPGYVIAINYNSALSKWKLAVSKENPGDEIEPPKGVQFLADDNEIILNDNWVKPL